MNTVVPETEVPDRQDRESEKVALHERRGMKGQLLQVPVSFGAYPEEIARWRAIAKEKGWSLSQLVRDRMLKADAREGS